MCIRDSSPAALLVDEVLSNWEKKEFDSASRNLRALLPWDPDRRRLIRTHIAFASAADWLHRLKTSPNPDTDFLSQITDFELEGRELRGQHRLFGVSVHDYFPSSSRL